jgi:uncharacterized protein (DUF486 family)
VLLLIASNVFMTFAWYRHLGAQRDSPLWMAILVSWGIAFFEYCLAVPANRLGAVRYTLPQLKVIQEVVSLSVFAIIASNTMGARLTLNHLGAAVCLVGAVFFTFR